MALNASPEMPRGKLAVLTDPMCTSLPNAEVHMLQEVVATPPAVERGCTGTCCTAWNTWMRHRAARWSGRWGSTQRHTEEISLVRRGAFFGAEDRGNAGIAPLVDLDLHRRDQSRFRTSGSSVAERRHRDVWAFGKAAVGGDGNNIAGYHRIVGGCRADQRFRASIDLVDDRDGAELELADRYDGAQGQRVANVGVEGQSAAIHITACVEAQHSHGGSERSKSPLCCA